jgi:hypothetical protein
MSFVRPHRGCLMRGDGSDSASLLLVRMRTLSKRARSTTPTSLRFKVNGLRAVRRRLSQKWSRPPSVLPIVIGISSLRAGETSWSGEIVSDLLILGDHLRAHEVRPFRKKSLSRSCAPLWLRPAAQSPDMVAVAVDVPGHSHGRREASNVQAEFKNGVLNVHLPKSATAKPKAIDVKVS